MTINRRNALKVLGLSSAALMAPSLASAKPKSKQLSTFRYCLNTSTISGKNLGIEKYIEIAAEAGYDGIEIWIRDLQKYIDNGHSLDKLASKISKSNLLVESAIGFAPWLLNDEGMTQMKKEMELVKSIGGTRIAAPAAGIPVDHPLDLMKAGEKYAQLLEIGHEVGIKPLLEFWGSWPPFNTFGQALQVAANADHPDAILLADVYHLFRGGSGFECLKLLNGSALEVFHMNDYPGNKPRLDQVDADRIYPGDGAAPMHKILTYLKEMGGTKVLSLELFNKSYWEQDPLEVAKTGLSKMKEQVKLIS